jgi:phage terminase large subunit
MKKIDFSRFYETIAPAFWDAFENKNLVRIYKGGAGSGKSFTAFSEMIYNVVVHSCNYLILRQTANSNRTSTFALTKKIISDFKLTHIFKENKTEMHYTCTINGAMIYFRGLEDVERLKSLSFPSASGILERIIFEEASEGNFENFSQLLVRLRGKSKNYFQVTLLLNPVSSSNWIKTTFYDRDDFHAYKHQSTYKDNPWIDENYAKTLEQFSEIDKNFYNIYALGEWGITQGVIFNNWETRLFPFDRKNIDDTQILAGCDWGYNHPTCITLNYIYDGDLYTFDECVAFELTNSEYMQVVKEQNFISKSQRVVYDTEDPARGKEFLNSGYSFVPAKKGKNSVIRTIDYIKSFKRWYIDPRCVRLLQEVSQYHWRLDKDGKPMDEPVTFMDDAIASVRYAVEHLAFMQGRPSVLSGTKSDSKKKLIEAKRNERKQRVEIIKAQRIQKKEAEDKIAKKM